MKYVVVTLLGGYKQTIVQDDFFKLNRKFVNVSIEVKDVPTDILKDSGKPGFDLAKALWQRESYDKLKVEEKKGILSKR